MVTSYNTDLLLSQRAPEPLLGPDGGGERQRGGGDLQRQQQRGRAHTGQNILRIHSFCCTVYSVQKLRLDFTPEFSIQVQPLTGLQLRGGGGGWQAQRANERIV